MVITGSERLAPTLFVVDTQWAVVNTSGEVVDPPWVLVDTSHVLVDTPRVLVDTPRVLVDHLRVLVDTPREDLVLEDTQVDVDCHLVDLLQMDGVDHMMVT